MPSAEPAPAGSGAVLQEESDNIHSIGFHSCEQGRGMLHTVFAVRPRRSKIAQCQEGEHSIDVGHRSGTLTCGHGKCSGRYLYACVLGSADVLPEPMAHQILDITTDKFGDLDFRSLGHCIEEGRGHVTRNQNNYFTAVHSRRSMSFSVSGHGNAVVLRPPDAGASGSKKS